MSLEDVIEEMKKHIYIDPVGSAGAGGRPTVTAFTLRFSYENRLLAQRVVQDLTGRLI